MNHLLDVQGLCKRYRTFALKDVTFSMPQGFCMGFIGPNGAGKTTTIKSILRMVRPDAGEIRLFGQPVVESSSIDSDRIGVVMDLPFYVEDWTVADVEKAMKPFYTRWDSARYWDLLASFAIERRKKVKELSRGMKVKLMLASALSHDAQLLILDEPTSGLDPVARDELLDLLRGYLSDETKGVLFSTHITSDLEKIADYITYIRAGQIAYTGEKDELIERYSLVKGGMGDLTEDLRRLVIGLRTYDTGFEGMIASEDLRRLPRAVVAEPITLDEIVVFMNKDGTVRFQQGTRARRDIG